VLLGRMRLSVSGQIYEVGDHFNGVLKWLDGAVSVCEIFQGTYAPRTAPGVAVLVRCLRYPAVLCHFMGFSVYMRHLQPFCGYAGVYC
jgi:hypothetical protein